MSWEFVCIAGVVVAALAGKLQSAKMSFVGLFSVALLLYIEGSNYFLTMQSAPYWDTDNSSQPIHRARTATAGAIMTAVINAFIIVVLGIESSDAPKAEEKAVASAV